MGLGKTVQTLALICHARQRYSGPPFLVVAPASVLSNWEAEAARFAPELKVAMLTDTLGRSGAELGRLAAHADVVVTSYTLFRLDFDAHAAQSWSGLILDEAQYVKNRHAKTHHCARKLEAPFKLAITGTPMENNLMELWSLLAVTAPGLFPSPIRFADYFAKRPSRSRVTPSCWNCSGAASSPWSNAAPRIWSLRSCLRSRTRSSTSSSLRATASSTTPGYSGSVRRCSVCSTTCSATGSRFSSR
jgi:hypothetical protein